MSKPFFHIAYFIFSIAACEPLFAQSNTRGVVNPERQDTLFAAPAEHHKILLVPFYSKMCMSQIDRQVNKETEMDYDQITEAFRKGLDLALYSRFHMNYVTMSLLQGRYKSDSVLNYIYGSTAYNYALVPGTKEDEDKQPGASNANHYMVKGQLEVPVDYSQRFMDIVVKNPKLLPFLYKKYHADTYLFINELDIKNVPNTAGDLDNAYIRQVTVHYSILNKDGTSMSAGIETVYFPYGENVPADIRDKYFTSIARSILSDYVSSLSRKQKKEDKE
ncbi:MAG: hypothetical protein HKL88_07115 [Bacteroidia bacterium]|nr:hypothetical protein [Bacteroidia bacterium]